MRIRTCAAAAAVLLVGAPVALAHEGNPHFLSQVNEITPAAAGVDVEVAQPRRPPAAAQHGGQHVVIEGYEGEPYARMLPTARSRSTRTPRPTTSTRTATARSTVPDGLDAKAEPRWKEVSRTGRFEWHDHRMHWMSEPTPKRSPTRTCARRSSTGRCRSRSTARRRDRRHAVLDAGAPAGPPLPRSSRSPRCHPARRRRGDRPPPPLGGRGAQRRRPGDPGARRSRVAALALLPAAASAHALLEATPPERGARLEPAPEQVALRFSEPVEAEFGAVRVFDARARGPGRAAFHPGGGSAGSRCGCAPGSARTATPPPTA